MITAITVFCWTCCLFLSCMDDEGNKVEDLMAGGDDYITKPYSLKELAARVYAQTYAEVERVNASLEELAEYLNIAYRKINSFSLAN